MVSSQRAVLNSQKILLIKSWLIIIKLYFSCCSSALGMFNVMATYNDLFEEYFIFQSDQVCQKSLTYIFFCQWLSRRTFMVKYCLIWISQNMWWMICPECCHLSLCIFVSGINPMFIFQVILKHYMSVQQPARPPAHLRPLSLSVVRLTGTAMRESWIRNKSVVRHYMNTTSHRILRASLARHFFSPRWVASRVEKLRGILILYTMYWAENY